MSEHEFKNPFLRDFVKIVTSDQAAYIESTQGKEAWEQYIKDALIRKGYKIKAIEMEWVIEKDEDDWY